MMSGSVAPPTYIANPAYLNSSELIKNGVRLSTVAKSLEVVPISHVYRDITTDGELNLILQTKSLVILSAGLRDSSDQLQRDFTLVECNDTQHTVQVRFPRAGLH